MVPDGDNPLPAAAWRNTSLRQVVRLSLPARVLRVRISNAFGTTPLLLQAAAVGLAARAGTPDLLGGTARPLRFNGEPAVMVPAGGEYLSDPVELRAEAGADLAVSLHFNGEPAVQTGHPGSHANSFVVRGDQVMGEHWSGAQAFERWYQLADVEVQADAGVGALAAIGDSITDGHGVKTDGNTRWGRLPRSSACDASASRRWASSTRASAAAGCCATAWDPTGSRASSATCSRAQASRTPWC